MKYPPLRSSRVAGQAVAIRLRLALAAAVIVPLLLFLAGATFDWYRLTDNAATEAGAAVGLLRENALKVLETNELLIGMVDQRISGMSWDDIRTRRDALSEELYAAIRPYPQISGIGVTDASGMQWAKATTSGAAHEADGLDVTNRDFWVGQKDENQGLLVTHAFMGLYTQRINLGISRRRSTRDGRFGGTIHTSVDVSYLTDFWRQAAGGQPDARVTLIRDDGEILARFPSIGLARTRINLKTSAVLSYLGEGSAVTTYRSVSHSDGIDRISAVARVGRYPLMISFGVSLESVTSRWLRRACVLGGICFFAGLMLAGSVGLALHQARQLNAERIRRAEVERTALEGHRLEVLGQLAAGVAHDFANVIQVVEMSAMLIAKRSTDAQIVRTAKRIMAASGQGRSLTNRMLDFARFDDQATNGKAEWVDPALAVAATADLLSATLGSRYRVEHEIEPHRLPKAVHGDRSGLEGAIMNLVVNGRDAMRDGGKITIRLRPVRISPSSHDAVVNADYPSDLKPGLYAHLAVSDTGPGMPKEVLARAGDPFFTTKPRGSGTGLGLAGVRSFVSRNGGAFRIDSVEGRGTTVNFWLPACDDSAEADENTSSDEPVVVIEERQPRVLAPS